MSAVVQVVILGDDSSLKKTLASSEASLASFGKAAKAAGAGLESVGRTLTHALTVPVVAAGVAATKMAYDYQTALTKTINLSGGFGISQQQLSSQIMATSKLTGQSATELANALYPVQSSLHNTAASMDVLTASGKMSALGMGDVTTTADALVSVMNVYGVKNMSAAKAADIFTSIVQNSKFKIDDLASSIGRVLPVAANAGVSFQALGGDLASLSHSGLSADQSVTGLSALISNMVQATRGTGNAAKELKTLGLSAKGLIQDMQTHGAITALDEIIAKVKAAGTGAVYSAAQWKDFANNMGMSVADVKAKFKGLDLGALQKIFPNRKALMTLLGLTDITDQAAQEAAKNVATSYVGGLDKIFAIYKPTDVAKIKMGLNDLKNDMINLGARVLPTLGSAISSVSAWWDRLGPKTQAQAVHFALMAAEIGPILLVGGKLLSVLGSLSKVLSASPWAIAAAGFAMLYINSKQFRDVVNDVVKFIDSHRGTFTALATVLGVTAGAFLAVRGAQLAYAAVTAIPAAATALLADSFWALDAAMAANPIGFTVAALALLGAALYEAYQHSETFRVATANLVNLLSEGLVGAIKIVSKTVLEFGIIFLNTVKGIISVGDTVLGWFGMSLPSGIKSGVDAGISYLNSLQNEIDNMHGTNIKIGVSVVTGTVDTSSSGLGALSQNTVVAGRGAVPDASFSQTAYEAQRAAQQQADAVKKAMSGLTGGTGPSSTSGGSGGKSASAAKAAAKAAAKKAATAAALAAAEAKASLMGKPLLSLEEWMFGGLQNTGKDGPVTKAAKALADSIKKNFTVKGGTVPQAATDAMAALTQLGQQASSFNTGFQTKLTSGADFVSVFKGTGAGSGDIKAYLTQQVAGIKHLGADLKILAAKGVPPNILQMLAAAGVDGVDQADALVNASGTDLAQIIGLGTQISSLSQSIADSTEASIFKPVGAVPISATGNKSSSTKVKDAKGHNITVTVNNAEAAKIAKAIAQALQNAS